MCNLKELQVQLIFVTLQVSEEAGFGRSLFERLSSLGHSRHLLNIQYRMHPTISQFPNSRFYNKQICDAPDVKHKAYEKRYLPGRCFGPYSFINVPLGKEEMDDVGHSRRNMIEVALVMRIVHNLYKGTILLLEFLLNCSFVFSLEINITIFLVQKIM